MKSINILLVDDHYILRQGVKSLLEASCSDISVVADVGNGEEALHLLRQKKIKTSIILMDINMPGIGGLEASIKILHYFPNVKIIGLSAFIEEPMPSKFLQAGAKGYISKESGIDEMIKAIRLVHIGQRYISPDIAQQLALSNVFEIKENPFDKLSKREFQISLMISKGLNVKNISLKLNLSSKTVNTYRYRIFSKLLIKNDVELAYKAMRHGLVGAETVSCVNEKPTS